MNEKSTFKRIAISSTMLWFSIFAIIPLSITLIISFCQEDPNNFFKFHFTLFNYQKLFHLIYLKIFFRSFYMAIITTITCLVIAYPFSYFLSRIKKSIKPLLILFVIIPFWTSSLLRSYAMVILLESNGFLNAFLIKMHLIHQPLQILYTKAAVFIGLVYNLLPFMILPLYTNIEKLDISLIAAAEDLGATRLQTFRKIIFPLTLPGILSGILLVFLPAMTLFFIPDLLGGAKSLLLGNLIQIEFLEAGNWPFGSAVSISLTIIMGILLLFYRPLTKLKLKKLMI